MDDRTVVFFDGVCNLCHAWVRFVIARDPRGHVAFAPLQSDTARRLLATHGGMPANTDSLVVLEGGTLRVRSEAALAVAARLRAPWPLLGRLARLVPRALRDAIYDRIARSRYRWFGRRDVCALPETDAVGRFLDGPPDA
ncbi:MAG: DCC1-like thiol-disulfide oxidoreductase family protein [Candidatus Eisenbacteria bacterium]